MTDPRPEFADVALWGDLQACLGYVHNASFEIQRGNTEAAIIWIEDVRRSLGGIALALAERDEITRPGYVRLAEAPLTPPRSPQEAAYIERDGRES